MPSSPPEIPCAASSPAKVTWTWGPWKATAMPRIFCGQIRPRGEWRNRPENRNFALSVRFQDVADFPVDFGAVAAGFIDQVRPFFGIVVKVCLGQQVRSLHDRLHGVAEIMRQGP